MNIKIITNRDEFVSLKDEWNKLYIMSGTRNCFLSYDWYLAWIGNFAKDDEFFIVTVYKEHELQAIAPLSIHKRTVAFLLGNQHADYADALIKPEAQEAVVTIIRYLIDEFRCRRLIWGPTPSDSNTIKALDALANTQKVHIVKYTLCSNPYVEIDNTFESYYAGLKKKLRQEIRTTCNNMERWGDWQFKVAEEEQEARKVYGHLVDFHLRRQGGKAGQSIFKDERNVKFFGDLIFEKNQQADQRYGLIPHLSAIIWRDRIVSTAYCLLCHDRMYYWIPSFDPTVSKGSLGKLHIKMLLNYCYEKKIKQFDFMGGDENYKFQWSNNSKKIVEYNIFTSKFQKNLNIIATEVLMQAKQLKNNSRGLEYIWRYLSKLR